MTMTRRLVNHGIRITASIALLLAVIPSPVRPAKQFGGSTVPNCRPRNFAVTKADADRGDAGSSPSSVTKADSLPIDVKDKLDAELEDEHHATSEPSSPMFNVLPSPSTGTHRELIGRALERATRPLRC